MFTGHVNGQFSTLPVNTGRREYIEIHDSGEFLDFMGIFNLGVVCRPTQEVNVSRELFAICSNRFVIRCMSKCLPK